MSHPVQPPNPDTKRSPDPFELTTLEGRLFVGTQFTWREPGAIARTWKAFMCDLYDAIPHKVEQMPVGLSWAVHPGSRYAYAATAEVEAFGDPAPGLVQIETLPGRYLVVSHDGRAADIFETYRRIWTGILPGAALTPASGPSLELHNDAFDPDTGLGGVRIHIPLKD